jgi:hypothetical protein
MQEKVRTKAPAKAADMAQFWISSGVLFDLGLAERKNKKATGVSIALC